MKLKIDSITLKERIAEVTDEIRMLKKVKREPGQPHWNKGEDNGVCPLDDAQLVRSKAAATQLCALTAHCRGRVHFAHTTFEEQTELLKDTLAAQVAA